MIQRLKASISLIILAAWTSLGAWTSSCAPAPPEELDPLASLASPELSATYTADYWNAQAVQGSAIWQQAIELCRDDGRRLLPNCTTVNQIHFLRALRESAKRTSKPYDGQDGAPFPGLLVRALESGINTEPQAVEETQGPEQQE
ncbi:MAG: hypothetical protein GY719_31240 [bacterium]|nr:hypothetical protein [bacterium]